MMPEIWLPTSTFTTGFNWPLAVTSCVSSPRDATAVSYRSALSADWFRYQPRPTPQASRARSHGRFRWRICVDLIIRSLNSFHFRPVPGELLNHNDSIGGIQAGIWGL